MLEKLAQEIAKVTSEIIGYEVLITDKKGIVLGANDAARVGTLHEASLGVIFGRKGVTHNAVISKALIGVKPGITLPIELSGTIVGTVGITGEPEQVAKYGMLVKKEAELLLRESYLMRSGLLRERALQDLIKEIAVFDAEQGDAMLLSMRGQEFGYDLNLTRVAIVIELSQPASHTYQTSKIEIDNRIRTVFSHSEDLVVPIGFDKYVALKYLSLEIPKEQIKSDIRQICGEMAEQLKEWFNDITVGIGSVSMNVSQVGQSYHDAWSALTIGKRIGQKVTFIKEHFLEDLLSRIPAKRCQQIVDEVAFGLMSQSDRAELFRTIRAWCESGFSPIEASKMLNIHRNTLFYRLNKIRYLTHRDLRVFNEALQLYLAVVFSDFQQDHE